MTYEFGEMNSFEEVNEAAEGLLSEGDIESLKKLAKENGIDEFDTQDYIDGEISELCTAMTCALGKIELEAKELQVEEIMEDWVEYIRMKIAEDDGMARAVKLTSKSLKGCIAELLKWSFQNAKTVNGDVKKMAKVNAGCKLGIPGMRRAKEIITSYYLGE